MIKTFLKELAESIVRNIKLLLGLRFSKKTVRQEVDALKKDGIYFHPGYLTKEQCREFIDIIDESIDSGRYNVWSDESGADHRLYFIDTISKKCEDFYRSPYFLDVLSAYAGVENPVGMLLAGRIDAVDGNLGSGGGWHRDSPFRHQTKVICYLSDVCADSGPFQYIPGSHKKAKVIKSYLGGVFKPGQYRFSESDIDRYISTTGSEVIDVTEKAGALMIVDTKGIHRGKPIRQGRRYVLFCYYWDDKIPDHFERLKQF